MEKQFGTNQATVKGMIDSDFTFSHQIYGEGFYFIDVLVKRRSDIADRIPVMISDHMIDVETSQKGKYIEIQGQFRSYNRLINNRSRLILSVYARKVRLAATEDALENQIMLDGYLCRPPVFRITPTGKEITDFMIAINRSCGKTDYIPCICWGKNARYAARMVVGGRLTVEGRIQSRNYLKKNNLNEMITKTTYEVSVSRLQYHIP